MNIESSLEYNERIKKESQTNSKDKSNKSDQIDVSNSNYLSQLLQNQTLYLNSPLIQPEKDSLESYRKISYKDLATPRQLNQHLIGVQTPDAYSPRQKESIIGKNLKRVSESVIDTMVSQNKSGLTLFSQGKETILLLDEKPKLNSNEINPVFDIELSQTFSEFRSLKKIESPGKDKVYNECIEEIDDESSQNNKFGFQEKLYSSNINSQGKASSYFNESNENKKEDPLQKQESFKKNTILDVLNKKDEIKEQTNKQSLTQQISNGSETVNKDVPLHAYMNIYGFNQTHKLIQNYTQVKTPTLDEFSPKQAAEENTKNESPYQDIQYDNLMQENQQLFQLYQNELYESNFNQYGEQLQDQVNSQNKINSQKEINPYSDQQHQYFQRTPSNKSYTQKSSTRNIEQSPLEISSPLSVTDKLEESADDSSDYNQNSKMSKTQKIGNHIPIGKSVKSNSEFKNMTLIMDHQTIYSDQLSKFKSIGIGNEQSKGAANTFNSIKNNLENDEIQQDSSFEIQKDVTQRELQE